MKKLLLGISLMLSTFMVIAQDAETLRALELVRKNAVQLKLDSKKIENVRVSNAYYDKFSGLYMVYLQQTHLGLPVFNQLMSLAFREGALVSQAGKFIDDIESKLVSTSANPTLSAPVAVMNALRDRQLPVAQEPLVISSEQNGHFISFEKGSYSRETITAELMWVPLNDGEKLFLGWQVYLIPPTTSDYWLIRIDANNGSTLDVSNLTVYCSFGPHEGHSEHESNTTNPPAELSSIESESNTLRPTAVTTGYYKVVRFPAESPIHPGGSPAVIENPWEMVSGDATTLKWHSNGSLEFNITRGNNVWAQEDVNGNNGTGTAPRSSTSGDTLTFIHTHSFTEDPTQTSPIQNQAFNTTNLFYWNNIIHDITYQFGFDEAAGNFQANNLGRGGQGNDFVFADAQDGSGNNNANFATPADGGNGRMQMYLWNGNPKKDGDVDNGVICHEFAHGISNRLTGGPSQAACLQNAEQMGEGWSDYYALMYTQNWATASLNTGFTTPRGIGTYVSNQSATGLGIRTQRYCTNFAVNSRSFSSNLPGTNFHHSRGEIWCATLWDMTWNIINQVGRINPNIYDVANGGGNVIALRLVTEGMKLQPCSPGFIDARDAILRADELLYGGAHKCAIWEAFRRRGMGINASQGSSNSVTDQVSDFTIGGAPAMSISQDRGFATEGDTIRFTTTVSAENCANITNHTLVDTLPTNVTYISGGTYNAANRTVTFAVNLTAGQSQNYTFSVKVNAGAYFPTVTLFEDSANGLTPSPLWTKNSTTGTNWIVSSGRSYSPNTAYFSSATNSISDHSITLTNSIPLGSNPPMLSFRHYYETEASLDGGLLEISTNNGSTWSDILPYFIEGGYNSTMDPSAPIPNRRAWTGSSKNRFIKTKINLTSFANQSIKLRFRYVTDNGTSLEGWYVDDIAIKNQALVEIKSQLFNNNALKLTVDTFTILTEPNRCSSAVVTADPVSVLACKNSTIQLQGTATGTDVRYQWQFSTNGGNNFSNLNNEITSTLTLSNVQSTMNNNLYRLIVFNDCPSRDTSSIAILSISDSLYLNQSLVSSSVCVGGNASFTGSALGTANSYQWEQSSDNGQTYQIIPGATSAFLNLSNVADSLNGRNYRLKITGCNVIYSNTAVLTVNTSARILNQPSDISACPGGNAIVTGNFSGTDLIFQWQESTDNGNNYQDIANSNNDTLFINNVNASFNNRLYRVRLSSAVCSGALTTTAARLLVSNNALIIRQPDAADICAGNEVRFVVAASGTGLQYQWEQSSDNGNSYTAITGATDDTLLLNNTNMNQNGYRYRVVVTNACSVNGVVSNAVVLNTFPPLVFNQQPQPVVACLNNNATFGVTVSGNPTGYQWQVSTDNGVSFSDLTGQNNSTLTLNNVGSNLNNNLYRLMGRTTVCPDVQSSTASLTVSLPAIISRQPNDTVACENSTLSLVVDAGSNTTLSYQWQSRTGSPATFTDMNGETSSILTLSSLSTNQEYRVAVQSVSCNAVYSDSIKVTVLPLSEVSLSANPGTGLINGQSITLTASSNPLLSSYNWFKNNNQIDGQTGSNLLVTETGVYYASGSDANNCLAISPEIVIRDSAVSRISVFPNPNKGQFKLRIDDFGTGTAQRQITIFDSKGARVYVKQVLGVTPNQIINVEANLPGGSFIIVCTDDKGEIKLNEKLIVQ